MAIRVWTKNQDFVDVTSEILEDTKTAFDTEKIIFQPYLREDSK